MHVKADGIGSRKLHHKIFLKTLVIGWRFCYSIKQKGAEIVKPILFLFFLSQVGTNVPPIVSGRNQISAEWNRALYHFQAHDGFLNELITAQLLDLELPADENERPGNSVPSLVGGKCSKQVNFTMSKSLQRVFTLIGNAASIRGNDKNNCRGLLWRELNGAP